MRVLYISNALTHYYNLVLNKLNSVPGIEIIVVIPKETSAHVGEAVHQTRKGITFKVIELEEYRKCILYSSFRGLSKVLSEEKPDVIITQEAHLLTFLFNVPVIVMMKRLGIKLIMQSIPFRLPTYQEARKQIGDRIITFQKLPRWLGTLLYRSGAEKFARLLHLYLTRIAYNIPDAHLNYVADAYDIYGTYGVGKNKIFITYNSPDTDVLLAIRESLASVDPILPKNDHRLVHIGRLVEWKRVDLLIRAFARVKKMFPDSELLILGYGPQEEELKRVANQLNVTKNVKFMGGIYDPKILGRYLMSSTVYVLAGMGGLSINDAMCFGLPVICSVCDGTEKYLVRDEFNGKYFEEGNEDDLVEKITYLFSNPQKVIQMGINSTEIIKNDINIHTVIKGFTDAFEFVMRDGIN